MVLILMLLVIFMCFNLCEVSELWINFKIFYYEEIGCFKYVCKEILGIGERECY